PRCTAHRELRRRLRPPASRCHHPRSTARSRIRIFRRLHVSHRGESRMSDGTGSGRVVIGGSSGFMGQHLQQKYHAQGREVITISRSGADLRWGDQPGIDQAVDGADLVIGLAGKSVNCRYTPENRAEIFRSRLTTTASLSRAIAAAENPPALWVNSSTATIYRHAEDRPMTESSGEIGN